jgi:IS5 family transposase
MTGSDPSERSKLGTKRHILTGKKGIPLSVVISPASTHDINLVTDVVDNAVIKRPKSISSSYKPRSGRIRKRQHLCLDKGYKSSQEEQELIKRGYVLHIPIRKKKKRRGEVDNNDDEEEKRQYPSVVLSPNSAYLAGIA